MKCCDMTPGMLRTSVALQSQTRTADGQGGYSLSWTTYATVQAHVKQSSGGERSESERLTATSTLRCVVRYRSDVEPQHRAVIDGKAYQVRNVEDVEFRRRWLDIKLEGGVAT